MHHARGPIDVCYEVTPAGEQARGTGARINNDRGGLALAGPTIGGDRDYGGPRVHAP